MTGDVADLVMTDGGALACVDRGTPYTQAMAADQIVSNVDAREHSTKRRAVGHWRAARHQQYRPMMHPGRSRHTRLKG
jgi:hypothetical protein